MTDKSPDTVKKQDLVQDILLKGYIEIDELTQDAELTERFEENDLTDSDIIFLAVAASTYLTKSEKWKKYIQEDDDSWEMYYKSYTNWIQSIQNFIKAYKQVMGNSAPFEESFYKYIKEISEEAHTFVMRLDSILERKE